MTTDIKIYLIGLNQEKAINLLLKRNVVFGCIKRIESRKSLLTVNVRFEKEVKETARLCNLKTKIVKDSSLNTAKNLLRTRAVLVFGLIAVFVSLLFSSGSFLRIEVTASQKIDKQQVLQLVEEFGLRKFSRLDKTKIDSLENFLNTKLVDVAYSLVKMKGSVLIVSIIDAEVKDKPIDFDKEYDIIANFSGKITRLLLIEGTQMVNVGDVVETGQLLVKGQKQRINGEIVPVRAIAEVYADVSATAQVEFLPVSMQAVDTGKRFCSHILSFCGLNIKGRQKNPYEIYRTVEKEFLLPILAVVVKSTVYYQQTMQEVVKTFEEEEDNLKNLALNLALKLLNIDNNYTKEYNIIAYSDKIIVEACVKTNMIIGN